MTKLYFYPTIATGNLLIIIYLNKTTELNKRFNRGLKFIRRKKNMNFIHLQATNTSHWKTCVVYIKGHCITAAGLGIWYC